MRLVVRPKLKTKLETKAFREAAKLLRLAAGDKEAFTGRLVAYALLSLSRHCKMNLLISGANREKKKKELDPKRKKKEPKLAFSWGRMGWAGTAGAGLLSRSCGEKRSPCSPSSPCPRDAHFYFSPWTHHDLHYLPIEEKLCFPSPFPPALGWDGGKGHWADGPLAAAGARGGGGISAQHMLHGVGRVVRCGCRSARRGCLELKAETF